ncbi:hypothetical protein R6G99_10745, partial [Actinotignum timonense]|nr:hypothetical protein [Actinotignum timonense]
MTLEQGIIAAEDFAPIAGSQREQAEKLPKRFVAGAVPRRQLPSYTLKPQIQQRTVAPYQAPEAPALAQFSAYVQAPARFRAARYRPS